MMRKVKNNPRHYLKRSGLFGRAGKPSKGTPDGKETKTNRKGGVFLSAPIDAFGYINFRATDREAG